MGIFSFLKKKDPRINHDLTDEDRALGGQNRLSKLEIARRKAELDLQLQELRAENERIKVEIQIEQAKQQLDELRGDDSDDIDDNTGTSFEDTLLATIAAKIMGGSQVQNTTPIQPQQQVTDTQILDYWYNLDNGIKKYILSLSDQEIAEELRMRIPNISQESINRAIQLIRK